MPCAEQRKRSGYFWVTVFLLAAEFVWLYSPSDGVALSRATALPDWYAKPAFLSSLVLALFGGVVAGLAGDLVSLLRCESVDPARLETRRQFARALRRAAFSGALLTANIYILKRL